MKCDSPLKQPFVHNLGKRSKSSLSSKPYVFNLNKRPSCQTLSNTLEISKKTPPTSTLWFSKGATRGKV